MIVKQNLISLSLSLSLTHTHKKKEKNKQKTKQNRIKKLTAAGRGLLPLSMLAADFLTNEPSEVCVNLNIWQST
jgi:hypothetical protein